MASVYIEDKKKLKGIRTMLLAVAVINSVVTIILGIISSFFENPVPFYLQALITGVFAYITPIIIYARSNGVTAKVASERFCLRRCNRFLLFLAAIMGICWQFVMVIINLPFNLALGTADGYVIGSVGELIAATIIICAIPAVFEEFLFRGIVGGAMSEFNTKAAAIFSATMFALLHADICGFVGYLCMGLVLSAVVRRTNSLYAAMIFHFFNNATAVLLAYFNAELQFEPALTIGLFIGGVFGFLILYALFMMGTRKREAVCKLKTSHMLGQNFVSVPSLLCLAVVVVTAILVRML